jgi:hypothetical protein
MATLPVAVTESRILRYQVGAAQQAARQSGCQPDPSRSGECGVTGRIGAAEDMQPHPSSAQGRLELPTALIARGTAVPSSVVKPPTAENSADAALSADQSSLRLI